MSGFDNKEHVTSPKAYRGVGEKLILGMNTIHTTIGTILNMGLQEQSKILLIGGGGGKELSTFSQYSKEWEFTVVDPSKKMIELANYWAIEEKIISRTRLLKGYVDDFCFPDASFNAITCVAVLHYLNYNEKLKMFKNAKRLLKRKGIFVWTVAVKPETDEELEYLTQLNLHFALQNGIEANMINKIEKAIKSEYHMMTSEEELKMIEGVGFNNRVEVNSISIFKTYVYIKN